jgi:glycosyltransferase involved in cell wall biosynthesis
VIPTRDRCELVQRALRSAAGQIGVQVETIVVDDGSTDGTPDVLRASTGAGLTVVRNERSLGVARARNQGLERASQPWVAFLDDDDLWAPTKLASQLAAVTEGSAWCCVGDVSVDSRLRVTHEHRAPDPRSLPRAVLANNVVPGGASGVLARTALVREVGGFDEGLRILADWELWIRLALASPLSAVNRPLVGYVRHGGNMSFRADDVPDEIRLVERKHAAAFARYGAEPGMAGWLEWLADMHRRGGRRRKSARIWLDFGLEQRRPRLFLRAASCMVWPGWVVVRDAQRRQSISPAWRTEAESWLAEIAARNGNAR